MEDEQLPVQVLYTNVQKFRGALIFRANRLLYHSNLGLRVIQKKKLPTTTEREFFFIDNLLIRIHFIIVMIWWTGLAPWEFEFPLQGSLASTFLSCVVHIDVVILESVGSPSMSNSVLPTDPSFSVPGR